MGQRRMVEMVLNSSGGRVVIVESFADGNLEFSELDTVVEMVVGKLRMIGKMLL